MNLGAICDNDTTHGAIETECLGSGRQEALVRKGIGLLGEQWLTDLGDKFRRMINIKQTQRRALQ